MRFGVTRRSNRCDRRGEERDDRGQYGRVERDDGKGRNVGRVSLTSCRAERSEFA